MAPLRKRAWTLLVRAYDECRRGVVFLEGEEAADEIAPTLVGAVRRRRSGSEVEYEDEADADGADEATTPRKESESSRVRASRSR